MSTRETHEEDGTILSREHGTVEYETTRKKEENQQYIGYYVAEELFASVYCELPDFLETVFPVPDALVDQVFACVSKFNRHYNMSKKTKRWKAYPLAPPQAGDEHTLRAPFIRLVNIIVRSLPKGSKANDLQWHVDDMLPAARDPCLPDIKPDIVATLGVQNGEHGTSIIPWSRIFVPVSIKTQTTESGGSAVLELVKYMRLIFHEAVDRCFVFGLVLGFSNVTVYLAHRGGVIGSSTFNIHEDPKAFIRVIVGLSTFSPDRLGLDTSLCVAPQRQTFSGRSLRSMTPKFSYEVKWNQDTDDYYWLLEMPKPNANPGSGYGMMDDAETETFVLFKGITLSKGGVIRGLATRVWKAWLLDDMHLQPKQRRLFVVKDSWSDDDRRSEGEIYTLIGNTKGVATMRSYSVVRVNGQNDTTFFRIQRSLPIKSKPRCIDMPQEDVSPRAVPNISAYDCEHMTQWLKSNDYLPMLDKPDGAPQGKVHTRLVMETYGWSVRYSASPLELVRVMKDAVEGYRAAYRRGVMQFDMSVENILITGRTEEGWRGALVDFDHAQVLGDQELDDDERKGTRPFVSAELLLREPYFAVDHHNEPQRVAPCHAFNHDLESILWILLWICLCTSGGGVLRQALYDSQHEDHEELVWIVMSLFEGTDSNLQGRTKWAAIIVEDFFGRYVDSVDDFYSALKPLLWTVWRVLHEGYQAHCFNFDAMVEKFRIAFDDAERELLAHPPVLSDAQKANVEQELARRSKDCEDWTHAPLRPVDSQASPRPIQSLCRPDSVADGDDGESHERPADASNTGKVCHHASPIVRAKLASEAQATDPFGRQTSRRKSRNANTVASATPRYSLRSNASVSNALDAEATAEPPLTSAC